jgi:hypothetical protein
VWGTKLISQSLILSQTSVRRRQLQPLNLFALPALRCQTVWRVPKGNVQLRCIARLIDSRNV